MPALMQLSKAFIVVLASLLTDLASVARQAALAASTGAADAVWTDAKKPAARAVKTTPSRHAENGRTDENMFGALPRDHVCATGQPHASQGRRSRSPLPPWERSVRPLLPDSALSLVATG